MSENTAGTSTGSIDALQSALAANRYVADRSLATALYLSLTLPKPLFLEGEAGVGKTEISKVLADILGTPLIRLQCYEGLDASHAVYEWNYSRQMLHIRLLEATGRAQADEERALREIFSPEFLIKRPLLQAIEASDDRRPVLLIDELDRADQEFEAFLLEMLSDFQITIPELGTIKAKVPPAVIITSNRTREIHDALKRRCLYFWIDYPTFEREVSVVSTRVPEADERLRRQVVAFMQALRGVDLYKLPGVAETLDWTRALVALGQHELTESAAGDTLGVVLKHQEDVERVRDEFLSKLVTRAQTV